jgi:hypothetical protein
MVTKLALPMTRLSMMRPATLTSTGSGFQLFARFSP